MQSVNAVQTVASAAIVVLLAGPLQGCGGSNSSESGPGSGSDTPSSRDLPPIESLCQGSASQPTSGPLANLEPGEWYSVPDSRLIDAAVEPGDDLPGTDPLSQSTYDAIQGTQGVNALTAAWSGGAFDSRANRMLVWGGGHSDYGGNEVYAFDIETLEWDFITLPSDPPSGGFDGRDVLPDGRPASRHTYDGIEYIPPPHDMLLAHGTGAYPGVSGSSRVFKFNLADNSWSQLPGNEELARGRHTAYDQETETFYIHDANDELFSIDMGKSPSDRQWTTEVGNERFPNGGTMVIDTKRHDLIRIGNADSKGSNEFRYDLDEDQLSKEELRTSGAAASDVRNAASPGLVYDPNIDRLVAWIGGTSVYLLNLDTLEWKEREAVSNNTVDPGAPEPNGTFGRFRYMPAYNAYILVNQAEQNVYFYRLADCS